MSIEPTQHIEPIVETGVTAYAIYPDYGNASDSSHVMLLSDNEMAKAVLLLIKDDNLYYRLAVSRGWGWAKSWRITETIARRGDVFCSLAEAQGWLKARNDEAESCD